MANEPTDMHGPSATAPTVSNKTVRCAVCKFEHQLIADEDTKGCAFCGAPAAAITTHSESPDYSGSNIIA